MSPNYNVANVTLLSEGKTLRKYFYENNKQRRNLQPRAPGLTLANTHPPILIPVASLSLKQRLYKSEGETTGMRKGGWCTPVSNQARMLASD